MTQQHTLIASLCLVLAGCSSMNSMIPSWGGAPAERSYTPANSTKFLCAGGKLFYVRLVDGGAAAWLIYPDREVLLTRAASGTARYSNGGAVLDINGSEATLNDGPGIAYSACKAATTK